MGSAGIRRYFFLICKRSLSLSSSAMIIIIALRYWELEQKNQHFRFLLIIGYTTCFFVCFSCDYSCCYYSISDLVGCFFVFVLFFFGCVSSFIETGFAFVFFTQLKSRRRKKKCPHAHLTIAAFFVNWSNVFPKKKPQFPDMRVRVCDDDDGGFCRKRNSAKILWRKPY